jgi:multiple sugar transport system substrate-binding protein
MNIAYREFIWLRWLAGPLLMALFGCSSARDDQTIVEFWAMGSEGERALPLIDEFRAAHPDIQIRVQQIPWNAAHEKLLTAFAGDTLPDVCQLGNTWIPEFEALGVLEDLTDRIASSPAIDRSDYFPGVWQTNVVDGRTLGLRWYVDTRLLFYRKDLLAAAGHDKPPATWGEWLKTMRDVQARQPEGSYAILLPVNEFEQPVILGLQLGADMLRDGDRYGNFSGEKFREAFAYYVNLFQEGLAPKVSNTRISNVWQEFERGTFAMYITGPWNVNEFRLRMSPDMEEKWSTAPWPRPPSGPGSSNAGGSSLVLFKDSPRKEAAWKFVEFLSQPRSQIRFTQCTGNLPPGERAWRESGMLNDKKFLGFYEQLKNVAPAPRAPEWEQIVTGELVKTAETVITGGADMNHALKLLDDKVDRLLEKRRWMLARDQSASAR